MTSSALSSHEPFNKAIIERIEQSPQWARGQFHNAARPHMNGFFKILKMWLFTKKVDTNPQGAIPVKPMSTQQLEALQESEPALFRLGHSSVLIWLQGRFWLTDPVFSERASPFHFFGPKRFHQPPIAVDQFPEIEAVILSHNHYDHMDKNTIKQLNNKVRNFYVPLGLGADLEAWGVASEKIHELDWWQSINVNGVRLTATPSQHFSGRSLGDRNKTLWASWAIHSQQANIFFSGDSGYFSGFKEIGERLGPFDFSLMETGAYDEMWRGVHMLPEESLQAHIDVQARYLVPIHNSTFDLAMHPWYEPFDKLLALTEKTQTPLLTPMIGEQVQLTSPAKSRPWWLDVAKK